MSGGASPCSTDLSGGSLGEFRRRQRQRLLSNAGAAQQPQQAEAVPAIHPADLFLRGSPTCSDSPTTPRAESSSSGRTSSSRNPPTSARASTSTRTSTTGSTTGTGNSRAWESDSTSRRRGVSERTATASHSAISGKGCGTIFQGVQAATGAMGNATPGRRHGRESRGLSGPSSTTRSPHPAKVPGTAMPSRLAASSRFADHSCGPEIRRVKLGIETEFYLAAKHSSHAADTLSKFVKILTAHYNTQRNLQHSMRSNLQTPGNADTYSKWSIVFEGSNARVESPWGLELRTPILYIFPNSRWRSHVQESWDFLERYYHVTGDKHCSTHIHISLVPNYSCTEIKLIASAVIHFEPAFVALMPAHRRGNAYAMSNWLGSPHLARGGRSRSQSIDAIERASDAVEVLRLIQGFRSANFCWNFYSLYGAKGTIEFRQPPVSLSLADSLSWAELALTFIQTSIIYGSSVRDFSADVGGLRSFLEKVNIPGVNEPERLRRIWADTPDHAAMEPESIDATVMKGMDEVDMLTKKGKAELREIDRQSQRQKRRGDGMQLRQ